MLSILSPNQAIGTKTVSSIVSYKFFDIASIENLKLLTFLKNNFNFKLGDLFFFFPLYSCENITSCLPAKQVSSFSYILVS